MVPTKKERKSKPQLKAATAHVDEPNGGRFYRQTRQIELFGLTDKSNV